MMAETTKPGPEAVVALRAALPSLTGQVNEKFAVDERFECVSFPCELAEMVSDMQVRFGKTLVGLYEFGLLDRLAREFGGLVRPVLSRGALSGFPAVVLDAWLMALRTGVPGGVQRELAAPLAALRADLPEAWDEPEPAPLGKPAQDFLDMLTRGDRREAVEFALAQEESAGAVEPVLDALLLPALGRVGEMWARNRMSAAGEHRATEVCRYVVLRLFDSRKPAAANGRRALVACAPGEEHELGAEMVAGMLELRGWEVFFVGRSAPQEEILAAAKRFQPDTVLLSATTVAGLPALRDLSRALRVALPGARLVAGGRAAVLARAGLGDAVDVVAESATEGCAAAEQR